MDSSGEKSPVENIQPKNAVEQLVSSCTESIPCDNHLEVPLLRLISQSKTLLTPTVNSENVRVDFPNNQIIFSVNQEPSIEFASTILDLQCTIKIEDMPNFPRDFAFNIFTDSKSNTKLSRIFPPTGQSDDNLSPCDLHFENDQLKLMIKFATSRDATPGSMRKIAEQKRAEYETAIKNRVSKTSGKRFCFSQMVCSKSSLLLGSIFNLQEDIINEICARYRFALDVLTEIGLQGLDIEDAHVAEMKENILHVLRSIPELYQNDFATSHVKMTRERLDTSEISPGEAEEFTAECYRQCLKASRRDTLPEDSTKIAADIQREFSERNRGTRTHMKHIIQLPNCLPPVRSDWKWEKSTAVDGQSAFINDLIEKNYFSDICHDENLDEVKRKACLDENDPERSWQDQPGRRTVHCAPSESYRLELAKNGVQRKSRADDPELIAEVFQKKLAFSLDVDVSDIDRFLVSEIPKKRVEACASVKKVTQLVLQALGMSDARGSNTEIIIQPIMDNLMFNWCSFISAIAAELCVALKQRVRKDEWMVKRLREWDAYLVMQPENRKNIFFSIVMPKNVTEVLPAKIARQPDFYSNYSVIEFVSTVDTKLVNLVKAESTFITMISQWSRHYGKTFLEGLEDPDVWAMTRLLILVHLEDKPKTAEIMTLFRYISMEKFSTCKTNAKKMLEKFPIDLRSRMQVWASKKLVNAMCMPNYEAVHSDTCDDVEWRNMINPYTGKNIDNPAQLIELYYVGYATNKDAKAQPFFDMDLLKKVLEYEIKLHDVDEKWCGLEEREHLDEYQFHEWSRRANCAAADHLKAYLYRLYGEEMENRLSEKIIHRLSQLTWDQVASLKASSQFDPSVGRIPSTGGRFTTQRIKVIIAILKKQALLAETPALSIAFVLRWINRDGGLRADIFKKPQHGGLREVFVLEVHSRILQLVLEEIARAVCQNISIETMMHPESKLTMPQTHMYESASKTAKYRRNISSSNDARVWNQGHHVAKFAQFLIRLLPKDFHNLIVGGLKQFLFKRIALPDGVLNYTERQLSRPQSDPIKAMFWDAWSGKINVPWLRDNETFLRIESGMMQGILHHTSSLYHAAMLMLRNSLWSKMSRWYSIDNITTDMVSSDDSARLTDVFSDDPNTFEKAVRLAKLDHIAIKHFSRLYGIWLSPKSTLCTTSVMEFNSEFYFHGNVFKPTLKWSLVALPIVVGENLVERQEIMNNQITILLEGGSGFRQASETQLAQVYLHYRLLGMGTNPLFLDYAELLMSNPDPALGFFLLDPPIAAGLAGFNFNLWKAITSDERLNKIYAHQVRQREISATTTGQLSRAVQIVSASRQNVRELIAEVDNVLPMWQENVEANPSVLYGLSRNLESSLMKIMVKLTSPNVIRSLSRSEFAFRVVAAGADLITEPVATVGSNWMPTGGPGSENTTVKVSLWRLITRKTPDVDPLTFIELNVLFPRRSQYSTLDQTISELNKYKLGEYGSKKMIRCDVRVFKDRPHLLFNLETVVRWKWFGEKLLASKPVADKLWLEYKKSHPWLEEDPFSTLKNPNCHFETQIQMSSFIHEHSTLARSVHLTGRPVRAKSAQDLVTMTIQNNQMPRWTLEKPSEYAEIDLDGLQSALAGILTFPLVNEVKEQKISERLLNYPDIWDGSAVKPSPRKLKLALIQYFLKLWTDDPKFEDFSGSMRSMTMRNALKSSQLAVYGGFVEKCQDDRWNGDGEWVGMIGDTLCRLLIKNFVVMSVTTDDFLKLHENESLLVGLLEEIGISACRSLISEENFDFKEHQFTYNGIVYENANLVENSPLELDRMRLQVTGDCLSLMCHDEKTGIHFTVVKYTIEPADFRFSTVLEEEMDILKCWLNNTSLNSSRAQEYLIKIMENDQEMAIKIQREEFKQFVKSSLALAMARAGVKRKIDALGDSDSCPVPAKSRKSTFDTENVAVDDLDFILTDEEDFPELLLREKVSYYDFCDYLEGNVAEKRLHTPSEAVKKIHRLWHGFVDGNITILSKEEKTLLDRQCFVPKIGKCIEIIEYYLDVKFDRECPMED